VVWQRLSGLEIFSVSSNPVRCDVALRHREIDLASADEFVKMILERVLLVSGPFPGGVRLRPEITNVSCATKAGVIR